MIIVYTIYINNIKLIIIKTDITFIVDRYEGWLVGRKSEYIQVGITTTLG